MEMLIDSIFVPACLICNRSGSVLCYNCLNMCKVLEENRCIVCDEPSICGETHSVCATTSTPIFQYIPYEYCENVREIVRKAKFGKKEFAALTYLSLEGASFVKKWNILETEHQIVPIPLSKKRYRDRGFNQSLLIAKQVARTFSFTVNADLLKRNKNTVYQSELSKQERKLNVQDAFVVNKTKNTALPSHVLLVDDISTTGATLVAATKALINAGVKEVSCFALSKKI